MHSMPAVVERLKPRMNGTSLPICIPDCHAEHSEAGDTSESWYCYTSDGEVLIGTSVIDGQDTLAVSTSRTTTGDPDTETPWRICLDSSESAVYLTPEAAHQLADQLHALAYKITALS